MLILSRKAGESIVLGDNVFVTVMGFKGRAVSIGIDAPDALPILRNELYQKSEVERQNFFLSSLRKYFPNLQNSINNYF